jgi:hypothetical protein
MPGYRQHELGELEADAVRIGANRGREGCPCLVENLAPATITRQVPCFRCSTPTYIRGPSAGRLQLVRCLPPLHRDMVRHR